MGNQINKATIGRYGDVQEQVGFYENTTIRDLLEKAGLSLAPGETIMNGRSETVNLDNEAKNGEDYYIVANVKNA